MKTFLKIFLTLFISLFIVMVIIIKNFDINSYKDDIIKAVNEATGGELIIDGGMELKLSLVPYFEANTVIFRNPSFPTAQDLLNIRRVAVKVAILPLLKGNISINEIILEEPRIFLATSVKGEGNWELKPKSARKQEVKPSEKKETETTEKSGIPTRIDVASVAATGIKITYLDGVTNTSYNIAIDRLAVREENGKMDIDMEASYNGTPIIITGRTSSIQNILAQDLFDVDIAAKILDTKLGISGSMDKSLNSMNLKVAASSDEATTIPNAFGASMEPLGNAVLKAKVTGSLDNLRLAIEEASLAGNNARGDINYRLYPSMQILFKLHSDKIDLVTIGGKKEGTASKSDNDSGSSSLPALKKNEKIFSQNPFDFNFMNAATIKGAITIDSIANGDMLPPITDNSVSIDLSQGVMQTSAQGKVGTGNVTLNATLDGRSGNTVAFKADAKGNLPAVDEVLRNGDIQGIPVDYTINILSTGASIAQIMANMNGNIMVQAGQGVISEKLIYFLSGDLLSTVIKSFNPEREKNIKFKCSVANLEIKNGKIDLTRRIAVETKPFNLVTNGHINLQNETLDMNLNISSVQGVQVGVSDLLSSMMQIKGTFSNPSIGVNKGETLKNAAAIGAAVITGGISLAGQKVAGYATEDRNPCNTALHGGVIQQPNRLQETTGTVSGAVTGTASSVKDNVSNSVKEIGKTFKNLIKGSPPATSGAQ